MSRQVPTMFRGYRTVLLLSSTVVILGIMSISNNGSNYTEVNGGIKPGRHVLVKLAPDVKRTGQYFSDTLKQVHRLLGEKRDTLMRFNENVLKERKDRISSVCAVLKADTTDIQKQLAYYDRAKVLYCPVPKVASKFWARLLHVMNTDDYISPFEFASVAMKVLVPKNEKLPKAKWKKYFKKLSDSSLKFVFAREPYKRIYSSYLDKFVSTNPMYWDLGKSIISFSRNLTSNASAGCGHDVKFSELVKILVAKDPRHYDRHFRPMSVVCDMCRVKYDVIGKVETFEHDVMYILNRTGMTERDVLIKDFSQEKDIHNIIFNTKRAFTFKKATTKCISTHVLFLRLWRILQMSGLIEKWEAYPLIPEESQRANQTTIMNLLLKAYHRSASGAKSNSQEALLQAYSDVPVEDMEKLRLKYLKDFMLFDYEDRPEELFEKRRQVVNFDYFDILKLS